MQIVFVLLTLCTSYALYRIYQMQMVLDRITT